MTAETLVGAAKAPSHPARYTEALLPVMARMLAPCGRILDPFGGVGGVFKLAHWLPHAQIEAVEIEPEWAAQHPRTTLGSALALPWPDGHFDGICTSPAYGNRMADQLIDRYDRITYASKLGRKLHPDNGGRLQWGEEYRQFHLRAWAEAARVLCEDGLFVLNIKDHIRAGKRQAVTAWHIAALESCGLRLLHHERVATPGMRYGQNADARTDHESVVLLTRT